MENNIFKKEALHKPHFRSRVRKRLAQFQNNRVIPKGERAAVEGRRHRDMQTDKWLEEIKDRVPEVEIGVQGWMEGEKRRFMTSQ